MKQILRILLFLPALLTTGTVLAQPAVTVAVFNESTSIPYTQFFTTPVHPGVQLGAEIPWREGRRFILTPALNIGYMFHQKLFQGLYVNLEMGVDLKTGFGLHLKGKFGLGYLHTFTTGQEYQFRDGSYVSRSDHGNGRLMPSLSIGLGYDLQRDEGKGTEIFMLYRSWLEYPYSPGFIPLMTHTDMSLGFRFHPFKNTAQ